MPKPKKIKQVHTNDRGTFYNGYHLSGDVEQENMSLLLKLSHLDKVNKLKNIINESAELAGRTYKETTLLDGQTIPVALSKFNPRLFIGDKPGLGKTVMSSACYALYRRDKIKNGEKPKKLLLITDTNHALGMSKEMSKFFGINLVPLIKGTAPINRTLKKTDMTSDEIDGVVTTWGSVTCNGFLYYMLDHHDEYDYAILDETACLASTKTQVFEVVDNLLNNYRHGIKNVLFLNGSSFEKSIYDLYNQLLVLSPRLFPNKKYIEENYVVRGVTASFATPDYESGNGGTDIYKTGLTQIKDIIDYKNQGDLRERIRGHYIARTKSDFSTELPQHNYRLYPCDLSSVQEKVKMNANRLNMTILNSPTTSNPKAKFNRQTVPKFGHLLDHFESVSEDRPIVYAYNRAAQEEIANALREKGYKVGILNGSVSPEDKERIREDFNNGKLDTLVFNIIRAMNLPTSDRVLFYDIPTIPEITYQVMGRIDRNNYTQPKFYDFFVYLDSPEMVNMVELAYFRETQSVAFTGQEGDVYAQLLKQLENYLSERELEEMQTEIQEFRMSDANKKMLNNLFD